MDKGGRGMAVETRDTRVAEPIRLAGTLEQCRTMKETDPVVGTEGANFEAGKECGDENVVGHIHTELRDGVFLKPMGELVCGWTDGAGVGRDTFKQIFLHIGHISLPPHYVLNGIGVFVVETAYSEFLVVMHGWSREPHAFGEMARGQPAALHRAGRKAGIVDAGKSFACCTGHFRAAGSEPQMATKLLVVGADRWAFRMAKEECDATSLVQRSADSGKVDCFTGNTHDIDICDGTSEAHRDVT